MIGLIVNICQNEMLSKHHQSKHSMKSLAFMENQGIIIDQNGNINNDVLYTHNNDGMNVHLKRNSFSYDIYSPIIQHESIASLNGKYQVNRIDITLLGANEHPQIQTMQSSELITFTVGIKSQGDCNSKSIRTFSKVIYSEIYPQIDMVWFINANNKVEYNFIVKPGGDPRVINMRYDGTDSITIVDESLYISTPHFRKLEQMPLCYTIHDNKKIHGIYRRSHTNDIAFDIGPYDINDTLGIDPVPSIAWGTYYGGSELDIIKDIAVDTLRNAYMIGETSSINQIATTGSHQSFI